MFGEAFLGENGVGNYCDVFLGRIEREVEGSNLRVEQLLGTVAAHELGHLLLGKRSHSRWGIMEPRWQVEELRQLGMGRLRFNAEESQLMRNRVGVLGRTEFGNDYSLDFWASSIRGRRASTETPRVPPVKPSM